MSNARQAFWSQYANEYEQLWRQVDPKGMGSVEGRDCAQFMRASGLDDNKLAEIWGLADADGQGVLHKDRFFVAMGLITLAQRGHSSDLITLDSMTDVPPPALGKASSAFANTEKSRSEMEDQQIETDFQAAGPALTSQLKADTVGGTFSKHTEYEIQTMPVGWVTRRRYRDFIWLSDMLERQFPYAAVPPLPEKKAMGRFEDKFVENRRRGLERFLDYLGSHPIIRGAGTLKLFLTATMEDFALQSVQLEKDIQDEILNPRGIENTPKPPVDADATLGQVRLHLTVLEKNFNSLQEVAAKIVEMRTALAKEYLKFGQVTKNLFIAPDGSGPCWDIACSRCMNAHAQLGKCGEQCDKVSQVTYAMADDETMNFVEVVKEIIGTVQALLTVFKRREQLLKESAATFKKLQANKDKFAATKAKTPDSAKIAQLDDEIKKEEQRCNRLRKLGDHITISLLKEIRLFHREKLSRTLAVISALGTMDAEASRKMVAEYAIIKDLVSRLDD